MHGKSPAPSRGEALTAASSSEVKVAGGHGNVFFRAVVVAVFYAKLLFVLR